MSFLGEVTSLGNVSLRPHDIEVSPDPGDGRRRRRRRVAVPPRRVRGAAHGAHHDGQDVSVILTRTHARALGLEEGQTVWLTPASGANVVPRMELVG